MLRACTCCWAAAPAVIAASCSLPEAGNRNFDTRLMCCAAGAVRAGEAPSGGRAQRPAQQAGRLGPLSGESRVSVNLETDFSCHGGRGGGRVAPAKQHRQSIPGGTLLETSPQERAQRIECLEGPRFPARGAADILLLLLLHILSSSSSSHHPSSSFSTAARAAPPAVRPMVCNTPDPGIQAPQHVMTATTACRDNVPRPGLTHVLLPRDSLRHNLILRAYLNSSVLHPTRS